MVLEAPTGFGKSGVAVAVARTLGTSYVCVSTKDLQTQYARDFPFLKVAKGKNNFICTVKEDFIRNGAYNCVLCPTSTSTIRRNTMKLEQQCNHTAADYGPCTNNALFKYNARDDYRGCKYRTLLRDYKIKNKGTIEENVVIDGNALSNYQEEFSQWRYLETSELKEELKAWRPCEYYHQLNTALAASHSIFNYSMFLIYAILAKCSRPPPRELLALDEAHRLEEEVVKLTGISIPRKRLRKYIPDFEITDYGYDDITKWIAFLTELEGKISAKIGKLNDGLASEAETYRSNLEWAIERMTANPGNWIISEIKRGYNNEIDRVEIKPLDISSYCNSLFTLCDKTLMMSATILDTKTFCSSIGLLPDKVKFIPIPSYFPLENRPIYPLNIEYLNYNTLNEDRVKQRIAAVVDKIMTWHKDHKGIIHTTSYKQRDFIKENISQDNRRRLLETDPDVERDEIISEHINAVKPRVLISPSLHLGLDLKDDLSRFQVIIKVPYPSLGDRWIDGKRKKNGQWYQWQTALKLIQGYGRSIRSKEDWAATYVLDSGFLNFVNRNRNILPTWFTSAIKWDM